MVYLREIRSPQQSVGMASAYLPGRSGIGMPLLRLSTRLPQQSVATLWNGLSVEWPTELTHIDVPIP